MNGWTLFMPELQIWVSLVCRDLLFCDRDEAESSGGVTAEGRP